MKSKAKSGKIYGTLLVRESIRTPDGPRSRTVCNISGLPPSDPRPRRPLPQGPNTRLPAQHLPAPRPRPGRPRRLLRGMDALRPAGVFRHHSGGSCRASLGDHLLPSPLSLCQACLGRSSPGTVPAAACGLPASKKFDGDDLHTAMDQLTGRRTARLTKGEALLTGATGKSCHTLRRKGTRASRRCWPAVILTAVNPLWAGRQPPGTAGTPCSMTCKGGRTPPHQTCRHQTQNGQSPKARLHRRARSRAHQGPQVF